MSKRNVWKTMNGLAILHVAPPAPRRGGPKGTQEWRADWAIGHKGEEEASAASSRTHARHAEDGRLEDVPRGDEGAEDPQQDDAGVAAAPLT